MDILGISELKWIGMGEFNSDDHYIYYCGQESLRGNGSTLIVNKRVWNAVLGSSLKSDRMILVCFQDKPFNITVIQVYVPATNAKQAEVEWFYGNLQDLLACVCASCFSCAWLCNSVDCSPPGSSVHGIIEARILEWVAGPSSRGSSWPRDQT